MDQILSYKNILRVAIPIILSGVAQNIVVVTDTAFLGQLGEQEIGAAGNAGIFYFVLMMAGMGLSTGSQIIMARRNGEERYEAIGNVFQKTLAMMLPLALFIFLFLIFLSPTIMSYITSSDDILTLANDFISYRSFGVFFAFINFCIIAFYVGITKTKVLTYVTVIMAGSNIFLDYSLIFGNFGFPEMGIKGAAIASSLADIIAFLYLSVYTLFYIDHKKYNLFKVVKNHTTSFLRILKIGSPVIAQNVLTLGSWLTFFVFIEFLGERELAVSHIVRSIYMILVIPLMGFSQTTNTLVSNLIGQQNQHQVLFLIKRIIILCLGITFIMVSLVWIAPDNIISIYSDDLDLIEQTKSVLQVVSVTIFFFCIGYILFNGVTGTGNTFKSLLIEAVNISIYIFSTYLIVFKLNAEIEIVWCSEFIYFTFLGLMSYWYLKKGNWQKSVI